MRNRPLSRVSPSPLRRLATGATAALAAALWLLATPALADSPVVRDDNVSYPREQASRVAIDVAVGEIGIMANDGDTIEARLTVRCKDDNKRCRERVPDVRLEAKRSSSTLDLRVTGYERKSAGKTQPEVELALSVPRNLAVAIDLGVGEIDATGLAGDVQVDLGVGEVRLSVPEAAVRSVNAEVGVGEADLSPKPTGSRSSSFLFLGNEVRWSEGVGRSKVRVEIGVGEADIRLTP